MAILMLMLAALIAACDGPVPAPTTVPGPAVAPTATLPGVIQPGSQPAGAQPPAGQPAAGQPATGQPAAQPPANQGPAAIVNGQPISMEAYQQQVTQFQAALVQQGLNPNSPDGQAQLAQMRQLLLDNMIDDVLIAQEAAKQG